MACECSTCRNFSNFHLPKLTLSHFANLESIWRIWQVIMKQKSFVLITWSEKIYKASFASFFFFVIYDILNVKNNLKNYSLSRLLVIEGWAKLATSNRCMMSPENCLNLLMYSQTCVNDHLRTTATCQQRPA